MEVQSLAFRPALLNMKALLVICAVLCSIALVTNAIPTSYVGSRGAYVVGPWMAEARIANREGNNRGSDNDRRTGGFGQSSSNSGGMGGSWTRDKDDNESFEWAGFDSSNNHREGEKRNRNNSRGGFEQTGFGRQNQNSRHSEEDNRPRW